MMTLLSILFFSTAFAAETQEFYGVCKALPCTEKMKKIEDNYYLGAKDLGALPTAYSGSCYHLSRDLDGEHEHFGLVLLHQKADSEKVYFDGSFGFFYPENPYAHYTTAQASDYLKSEFKYYLEPQAKNYTANFAFAYPDILWQSWFTYNSSTKGLNLISAWSPDHWVFCDLKPNAN